MGNVIKLVTSKEKAKELLEVELTPIELTEGEAEALRTIQTIVADAILEMVEEYYNDEDINVGDIRAYSDKIRGGE